jgi:fructose-bisphosphate aldolase class 1
LQENEEKCSKTFSHRAKMNSLATKGMWTKNQEN